MSQRRPLYVRLPAAAADRLDRAALERKTSKQEIVSQLVTNHLGFTATPRRVTVELPADDGLTVGSHSFRPNTAEVLTLTDAAEMLAATEEAVAELAESGELPGRKVGGEWRFARTRVLRWLEGDE